MRYRNEINEQHATNTNARLRIRIQLRTVDGRGYWIPVYILNILFVLKSDTPS